LRAASCRPVQCGSDPVLPVTASSNHVDVTRLRVRLAHRTVECALGATAQSCICTHIAQQGATYRHFERPANEPIEQVCLTRHRLRAIELQGDDVVVGEPGMRAAGHDPAADVR